MTELLLTAVLAALVFALCRANVERKGQRKRQVDAKAWAWMTHRGGPIEPPPERVDVERRRVK